MVFQIGSRPNSRVERQFAGRAGRQGQPGRYHRMLTMDQMTEIGVSDDDVSALMSIFRSNKDIVAHYHFDLLLNGRNADYQDIVDIIDNALIGTESSFSSSRVEDFKAYSITDLIQTSLLVQMDRYRLTLKNSMEHHENEPLQELAAELATPEPRKKSELEASMAEVKAIPIRELQKTVFAFINHIVDGLIPDLRQYSESAIQTTKLAGQVKYDQKPEDMMMSMLKEFLDDHHDEYFVLKLPSSDVADQRQPACR